MKIQKEEDDEESKKEHDSRAVREEQKRRVIMNDSASFIPLLLSKPASPISLEALRSRSNEEAADNEEMAEGECGAAAASPAAGGGGEVEEADNAVSPDSK